LPIVTASDDTGLLCRARGKAERKSGTALVLFQTKRLDPHYFKELCRAELPPMVPPEKYGHTNGCKASIHVTGIQTNIKS